MKNATFDTFNHQKTTFITYFVKIQSRNNVARPQNETVHTSSLKKNWKGIYFFTTSLDKQIRIIAKISPQFVDGSGFSSENIGNFTFINIFSNSSGSFGYVVRSQ